MSTIERYKPPKAGTWSGAFTDTIIVPHRAAASSRVNPTPETWACGLGLPGGRRGDTIRVYAVTRYWRLRRAKYELAHNGGNRGGFGGDSGRRGFHRDGRAVRRRPVGGGSAVCREVRPVHAPQQAAAWDGRLRRDGHGGHGTGAFQGRGGFRGHQVGASPGCDPRAAQRPEPRVHGHHRGHERLAGVFQGPRRRQGKARRGRGLRLAGAEGPALRPSADHADARGRTRVFAHGSYRAWQTERQGQAHRRRQGRRRGQGQGRSQGCRSAGIRRRRAAAGRRRPGRLPRGRARSQQGGLPPIVHAAACGEAARRRRVACAAYYAADGLWPERGRSCRGDSQARAVGHHAGGVGRGQRRPRQGPQEYQVRARRGHSRADRLGRRGHGGRRDGDGRIQGPVAGVRALVLRRGRHGAADGPGVHSHDRGGRAAEFQARRGPGGPGHAAQRRGGGCLGRDRPETQDHSHDGDDRSQGRHPQGGLQLPALQPPLVDGDGRDDCPSQRRGRLARNAGAAHHQLLGVGGLRQAGQVPDDGHFDGSRCRPCQFGCDAPDHGAAEQPVRRADRAEADRRRDKGPAGLACGVIAEFQAGRAGLSTR